jgi:hypothetical protein
LVLNWAGPIPGQGRREQSWPTWSFATNPVTGNLFAPALLLSSLSLSLSLSLSHTHTLSLSLSPSLSLSLPLSLSLLLSLSIYLSVYLSLSLSLPAGCVENPRLHYSGFQNRCSSRLNTPTACIFRLFGVEPSCSCPKNRYKESCNQEQGPQRVCQQMADH